MNLEGKKILSIYYKHKPGGLCKRLYMMFEAWTRQGGEIHYIAVVPYPLSNPKIIPHILWTPFLKKEGLLFWAYFTLLTPFYALWIALYHRIDLVSLFGAYYSFVAIFPKILLRKKVIIFVRSDVNEINRILARPQPLLVVEDFFLRIGFWISTQIVTVNHHLRETMIDRYRLSPEKVTVLENHIPDRPKNRRAISRVKLKLHPESFVIVTVGVLDERKNVELLIRAAAPFTKVATLLIVGEGPERVALESLADDIKGKTNVIFTGWQEEVRDFLIAANLFVFPSWHEGCANALLEGLSLGLPVLASDIPANREILRSECLLFDPGNKNQLTEKIERFRSDPFVAIDVKKASEESRQRFIFDWDRAVVDLHRTLLQGPAS